MLHLLPTTRKCEEQGWKGGSRQVRPSYAGLSGIQARYLRGSVQGHELRHRSRLHRTDIGTPLERVWRSPGSFGQRCGVGPKEGV